MKERGFTLIELVVVLAVLGILAGIAVPSMFAYRNRAAHGVNQVNLLTTARQLEALRQAFPDDITGELNTAQRDPDTGQFFLHYGQWDVSAPVALEVRTGGTVIPVAAGTPMNAWLQDDCMHTSYTETGGTSQPEELPPPTESPPPEPSEPPAAPIVPPHTCRDRDQNCACDTQGCETVLHEEMPFVDNGNCKKCGLHYIHRGVADYVCDTCGFDLLTGQPHVCSWDDGVCRCRCGMSRCDHGSSGIGKCSICGNFNVWTEPCENCKKKG